VHGLHRTFQKNIVQLQFLNKNYWKNIISFVYFVIRKVKLNENTKINAIKTDDSYVGKRYRKTTILNILYDFTFKITVVKQT